MALALSNALRKFYDVDSDEGKAKDKACTIFKRLVEAPWMSSGLTANNAFSTTLILRTYGFLKKEGLLDTLDIKGKSWELHLGIRAEKIADFASFLKSGTNETAKFLYASLSDNGRTLLNKLAPTNPEEQARHLKKLVATLALDLRRLIQSGWIYTEIRFPLASEASKKHLKSWPTGYELAGLNQRLFVEQLSEYFLPTSDQSLAQIAAQMAQDPQHFGINEYSPTPTVLYWFVDALERGEISLEGKAWEPLCKWATQEFNHERSLVLADHDAMMDPVAMAMAACLCSKLRRLAARAELGTDKAHREMLPSVVELERSILELFKRQALSGIWPKYFPLFHYQDAGSNFCFTFEMLEAVLCEFGHAENSLLDQESFVDGIEAAITWCEENRLRCSEEGLEYAGWNSGGDIESLEKERPESWATAVVHMFLWELANVLSQRIQMRVLCKYRARQPKISVNRFQEEMRKDAAWRDRNLGKALNKLQDIELFIDRRPDSLIRVLKEELLDVNFGKDELQIRRNKAKGPLSALLFGPPGTSKTQITKAIADDFGWPMIEINPSEFVKGNFANVYLQAEEIFTDLMDLYAVVVLFDEMDALTQKRGTGTSDDGNHLDTPTQFLTTSMLPKLTALHDRAGIVFFMATNYQENFDSAIKRAGRFDLHLCMGPPKLKDKIDKIKLFFDPPPPANEIELAQRCISEYLSGSPRHRDTLELFTFGDFKSFLKRFGKSGSEICSGLEKCGQNDFFQKVEECSQTVGLNFEDLNLLTKSPNSISPLSKIDSLPIADLDKLKGKDVYNYFRDRRLSKRQF
jgi:hypothetical protein